MAGGLADRLRKMIQTEITTGSAHKSRWIAVAVEPVIDLSRPNHLWGRVGR